jgi:DNA-binding NtrC family response regulator
MAKIIIVDDEESILRTMRVLLMSEGHEVTAVKDSAQVVGILQKDGPFDLMITDLRMAPPDGMELMRLAHDCRPEMPILVVSAYASEATVEKSFSTGCIGYVKKPFRIDDVLVAIRKALAGEKARPTN